MLINCDRRLPTFIPFVHHESMAADDVADNSHLSIGWSSGSGRRRLADTNMQYVFKNNKSKPSCFACLN